MRDVEASNEAKDADVFRIHHQRSRYVYQMYGQGAISKVTIAVVVGLVQCCDLSFLKELFDWCVREKVVDGNLVAKWKKQGYEKLCCVRCIQPKDTNYGNAIVHCVFCKVLTVVQGNTCICRVPRSNLDSSISSVECVNCGCKGCASGD
jgi:bud site selection protein 31